MRDAKVGKILTRLLSEHNLRVSELARKIDLPQPTVQRIATGVCENPHNTSLKPIAKFFSLTVDQLKGLEPIPAFDNIRKLPLISWSEASHWNNKVKSKSTEHVVSDLQVSQHAYALKVSDGAMEPMFPCGTILIVDPDVQPKDRSYVICLRQQTDIPIFRQLIINGQDMHLKPLSPDTNIYKMLLIKKSDAILATVVQARWTYMN